MKSIDATFNVETHSVGKQAKSLLLEFSKRFSENLREQEFRCTKKMLRSATPCPRSLRFLETSRFKDLQMLRLVSLRPRSLRLQVFGKSLATF